MRIGIDIRSLASPIKTGVATVTTQLLHTVFSLDRTNEYFLFWNAARDMRQWLPVWPQENIHVVEGRWPNRLLNTSLAFLQRPRLDRMVGKRAAIPALDYFFAPNINFVTLDTATRLLLMIHDLSFAFFPDCYTTKQRLWHRLTAPRQLVKRAHIIFTPSENTKRDVMDYFVAPSEKIEVLLPGVTLSEHAVSDEQLKAVKERYNVPPQFLLFLGTIEPRKNILGLIEAYTHLSPALQRQYPLLIAGSAGWKSGPIHDALARTPGVRYLGFIREEDKPALYQAAALFLYPSLYEGFGLPVLEAMVHGTAVLTSHRSSLPEVGGDAVWYSDPDNIDDITRGITQLLEDPALRQSLGARGRERAKRYEWIPTATKWLSLLQADYENRH